jgi:hypothetical protein
MLSRLTVLVVTLVVVASSGAAEFDPTAYNRSTISGILEKHKATECRKFTEPTTVISGATYKYRIITNFSRDLRPLSKDAKELIKRFGKSVPSNQRIVEMYQNELLVQENGADYWVPVQEQLIPAMGDELKQGQRFELYVALIGAINNRCVFIATEFNANPKDA